MLSNHRFPLSCCVLALALAGCATPESRTDAYEKALSQWQGAPEDALRARWGTPAAEEQADRKSTRLNSSHVD